MSGWFLLVCIMHGPCFAVPLMDGLLTTCLQQASVVKAVVDREHPLWVVQSATCERRA